MRFISRIFLTLALFSTVLPAGSALAGPAATTRLRLGVTTDGLVRITPADLTAAGVDPDSVDPRTFALSSMDQPVAIRVTGEADGRFDTGDQIEYFGQRFRGPEMDQKYTDERVYWLDIGGTAGPRIADVDATPQGALTPPADFPTTVHAEQNSQWWTLHCLCLDTQDTWFWDRLQPIGAGKGITRTFPYTVPHPAAGFTATLRLEEISRATVTHHITTLSLNGALLGSYTWDGKQRKVFTATAASALLASGANTVTIGALNKPAALGAQEELPDFVLPERDDWLAAVDGDPAGTLIPAGLTVDDVYVNYWEVNYRRQFRPWQGQLDFAAETGGLQEYVSRGWSTAAVAIWDVSDPLQPKRLTGATTTPQDGGFALRFRATPVQGDRFRLQEQGALMPPATLRQRPPTELRAPAGGADAVIVTPAALRVAADLLADWHRSQGRRALVVDIQDVFDEFNDGIYHPKAVPAMLSWAQTHWVAPGPRYLTLMGDGHWNFKGYNPGRYQPVPIMIPPYLMWADPWQGEVPADTLYGDINGDGLPEIAVGRISANTLSQALVIVNKISAYSAGARSASWQQRAIFVADRTDPASGDFPAVSDSVIQNHTPSDLTPQRIYLGQTVPDATSAREAIASAINAGAFMLQYTGHGAAQRWANELIWQTTDFITPTNRVTLTNGTQLPIVMTFNCLDGYFAQPPNPQLAHPSLDAMAEEMHRIPGGGSIGAISPSGLGLTDDQLAFREILLDILFKEHVAKIGDALMLAKQRFHAQGGPDYLIATETLFGDPAMRLPQELERVYLPVGMGTR